MVFGGEHEGDCERYSTWDEAETGHKQTVARISASSPSGGDEPRRELP